MGNKIYSKTLILKLKEPIKLKCGKILDNIEIAYDGMEIEV